MILLMSIIQAKPCMTDIYFGNGIWSPNKKAQEVSLKALKNVLNLDKSKEGQTYNYKLAYNPGHGTTNDLIETYWQLKESGQISKGYFTSVAKVLSGAYTDSSFSKKLLDIVLNYEAEVTSMYTVYNDTSFKQKHNVLLVAHSQGNLFGNKMFKLFTDAQKEKFRMVSVGTMSDKVAGDGNYVNIANDYVVNIIPDALKGDFDGRGHDFKGVYLNIDQYRHWYDSGSVNAGTQIVSYIKSAYGSLIQTTNCTEYTFTRVWMRSFGVLNVYGNADGEDELVGEVTLEQGDAILDPDTNRYRCENQNSFHWGDDNYTGYNWTYNHEDGRYNSWLPGKYITSRSSLDGRASTKEIVRKDTQCVTITLEKESDLYTMIYDMFPE